MRTKTKIQIARGWQPMLDDKNKPFEFSTEAEAKKFVKEMVPGKYQLVRVGKLLTVEEETVKRVR